MASISIEEISAEQAETVIWVAEGQFADVKSIRIEPNKLSKTISAFANSDGGDLYVGINEISKDPLKREWEGFANEEASNGHLQIFEKLFSLGTDFQYEFLAAAGYNGLVLHIQVARDCKGVYSARYPNRSARNVASKANANSRGPAHRWGTTAVR